MGAGVDRTDMTGGIMKRLGESDCEMNQSGSRSGRAGRPAAQQDGREVIKTKKADARRRRVSRPGLDPANHDNLQSTADTRENVVDAVDSSSLLLLA